MKLRWIFLPNVLLALAVLALLMHGPIPQLDHYHDFADQTPWLGIPHAMDVLSNVGFVIVGWWGVSIMLRQRQAAIILPSYLPYLVFVVCIALTSLCSSFYHLAPDNARLLWDRIPIALACAAIVVAVRADLLSRHQTGLELAVMLGFALGSVIWWQQTGDLRPYLLLQVMALLLIPVYQWVYGAPLWDKLAFGAASLLYVLAKFAELQDGTVLLYTHCISGHSVKHLLAALAAAAIVARLRHRFDKMSCRTEIA